MICQHLFEVLKIVLFSSDVVRLDERLGFALLREIGHIFDFEWG
jgi:hypothetical protein